ncbi:hypothetical protein RQP46_000448 [Phenoliferia psychrophenolica]
MFTFCIQKDTIRVEPRDFGKDPAVAIREEIHRRYANKILPEVGLCISMLDILDSSEGAVLYGDGCFYYKVEFRLVIFRPYIGEALVGKVQSQSPMGVVVSVGFFDDILVPPILLQDQTGFDTTRQAYYWVQVDEDGKRLTELELSQVPVADRLYIEKKHWVCLRVEEEHWDDSSPLNGKALPTGELPPGVNGEANPAAAIVPGKAPYSLVDEPDQQDKDARDHTSERAAAPLAPRTHDPPSARSECRTMIRFILVQNRQGKTRLSKWYVPFDDDEKIRIRGEVHRMIAPRDQKYQSNFVEFRNHKLVYRRYAGLFFCFCVDANDNELIWLEGIHLFVEVLDAFFGNVCELDLVFNFYKVYAILDEVFLAGEIEETSKSVILDRLDFLEKLE